MSTRKVLSDPAQVLPCALEELGCETTSLDPYAHIWDYRDNCVVSVLRTEAWWNKEQYIKILVDPNQQLNLYLNLKTTPKNNVKNRQIFTRPITIHSMWQ